jgi:hypothetical protein
VLDDDCVSGLFCDRSAACPGLCKPLLPNNGVCNRGDQCQDGLQCLDGRCGETSQHNEACGGGVEPDCHLGLFCIGEDRAEEEAGACKTKSELLVAGVNETCNPPAGVWCEEGLSCVVDITGSGASTTLRLVCKDRVGSGEDCNTSILPQQCPAGEYCPADLDPEFQAECVGRPPSGYQCGAFNLCAPDHYCDSEKRCRPIRRLQGAGCNLDGECLSGVCRTDADGMGKHCVSEPRCRLDDEPPAVCGDQTCNRPDETCTSCPSDCGACPLPVCGDALCNGTETCESCEGDCGYCPVEPTCGDEACNGTETCSSCARDCGQCPVPYSGPCDNDGECASSQVCDLATVPGLFGLPPNSYFGVCTTTCSAATQCPGPTGQRACGSDGRCYLQCDNFDLINPNRWCPLGMECIDYGCTWRR